MADSVFTVYQTWTEYLAALEALPDRKISNDPEWCDGATYPGQAIRVAREGWSEGAALVRKVSLPVLSAITGRTEATGAWSWDVTGSDYDVGEYLSGAPECWLTREVQTQRPCVTLSVHTGSQGGVPNTLIRNRGAALVSLAMALQGAGYAVTVYAVDGGCVGGDSHDIWTRVTLTDDNGGPLDTDRLMFALAHPGSTRTLAYSHRIARSNQAGSKTPHNLSLTYPSTGPKPPLPAEWKTDLHLTRLEPEDSRWADLHSVEAWVAKTLAEITGGAV